MKIVEVAAYPVWVGHRNQLLVKITTDEGIYGWGESGLSGREKAVVGAIDHYRPLLIGRDPFETGALWQEMYRSQYFEGGRVLTAAISAIDVALYDIKGKALGVPVWQLLGGKHRDRVPSMASVHAQPGPAMIEQVEHYKAQGFDCIRLQRGIQAGLDGVELGFQPLQSIAKTAPWVVKAREAVGLGVILGIDYHHRLSVAEAAAFCQRLPLGALDFLEEPIRDESPEAYRTLRTMTPIPFAIGEEFASKWQAKPYLEQGLTQYMRLDVCNIGGFTESMKVAGWCEASYVDLLPHNPLGPICTAASVHLGVATPNFAWLEYNRSPFRPMPSEEDEIFTQRPKLEGTSFALPTAPGLGIEIDEQRLVRDEFRLWNPPMLRRDDGSHTNW